MIISDLIKKSKTGKIELMTDGLEIRDFINAKDVARAMILIMEKMPNNPIAIGSGKGIYIKKIAQLIAEKTGAKLIIGKEKAECRKRIMDVSDLKQLGFRQKIGIIRGINEVLKWNSK